MTTTTRFAVVDHTYNLIISDHKTLEIAQAKMAKREKTTQGRASVTTVERRVVGGEGVVSRLNGNVICPGLLAPL